MDSGAARRYKVAVGSSAAYAVVAMLAWLFAPHNSSGNGFWIWAAVIFAGGAFAFACVLVAGRGEKYKIDDDGILSVSDGEERWISWDSVKSVRPGGRGLELIGAAGDVVADIPDDLHGFDDLSLFIVSKVSAPAVAASHPAPGVRRYENPPYLAGSTGFALVLFLPGCLFTMLAITDEVRLVMVAFAFFGLTALYLWAFLSIPFAIEIAADRVIFEYPWRKTIVPVTGIATIELKDYIGRHAHVWHVGLVLRDGRTITLKGTRPFGVDATVIYHELCAIAPQAAKAGQLAAARAASQP